MNSAHTQQAERMKETKPELSGQECNTLDTFNRHVTAFQTADLNAVLNDFSDNAMVITQDGVFQGKENIRTLYENLLQEFGNIKAGDSPGIMVDAMHYRGDMLFITWHAESQRLKFPFGTDTFLIKGNKIERQSIAFTPPQPRT
jgi:hypothetical protein